jgi:tRNA-2-methylthio-N6-dimethylallyladenosine synthase
LLHLPVQSGSDRILAAMKRGYSVLEYKSIVRKLRAARPDLSLTSDFIIGFPGETEADFDATMKLIEELRFDGSFSFIYSARPGTPAADLPDDVSAEVKSSRLTRLQERVIELFREYSQAMLGTTQRLLIEGASHRRSNEWIGRTGNNRQVHVAGESIQPHTFIDVRIIDIAPVMRGELIV